MAGSNPKDEADVPMYGIKRPSSSKSKAIQLSSTAIHQLSTELALAKAAAASGSDKPRSSRSSSLKEDIYKQKKVTKKPLKFTAKPVSCNSATEAELARSRAALERKAKQYEKLKRGKRVEGDDQLVDWDRKWAEDGGDSSFEDTDSDDEDPWKGYKEGDPVIEWKDELGRDRTVPKAWAEKQERKLREEEESSVQPVMPESLIYGPTIQTQAFQSAVPGVTARNLVEEHQRKIENEQMEKHYDANAEVRTKGVGFFNFSQDERKRKEEMEALERERQKTENERLEREEKKRKRKEEIEKRREMVKNKRRQGVGGKWLENMFDELEGEKRED